MIVRILFKVLLFFNKPNMSIIDKHVYTDGTVAWSYKYGSRQYTTVGKPPEEPPTGVFFTVQTAVSGGKDVTEEFKRYAGPKCNHMPDTGYIMYRRVPRFSVSFPGCMRLQFTFAREKGSSEHIQVTNIAGQESVFGAR